METGDGLQQGGLSGTIRPQHTNQLTGFQGGIYLLLQNHTALFPRTIAGGQVFYF